MRSFTTLLALLAITYAYAALCAMGGELPVPPTATVERAALVLPHLQQGDLLFQDLDCGGLCDAIEAVTEGVDGMDFSHVGIAAKVNGRMMVIEAIGAEVRAIDLEVFFQRSAMVVVGRPHLGRVARRAAHEAIELIGTPYDQAFLPGNDKLYCSELVALCYERANHGSPLFGTSAMTFKDPRTNAFFQAWVDYYADLGIPIPEGQPGCNPGGISREAAIEIMWRAEATVR